MRKNLFFVAVFAVITSIASGAEYRNMTYSIRSFEKGLNSKISILSVPANQASVAEDVRFNKIFGAVSKRDTLLSYEDFGTGAITGLHRYYKTDGTVKTLASLSTYLKAENDSTVYTLKDGLSDGQRWQFVTFKDIAIGGNGTDKLVKYDGKILTTANTDEARTADNLCAELGAPFAELNTGTDLDASSWYQYKVAFYDGSNYSYSTARSNPILTGAAVHNIYLTGIPIGPAGTTHRYIYRTLGAASRAAVLADTTFYLVGTLSDNSTTVFADDVADDDADADDAPTWATASGGEDVTPPVGKYLEIHGERLFVAGNSTYESDVYWSDDGNPDYFELTSFATVREDDGDSITFLKNFIGVLTIGKNNTIQKFYTDGDPATEWKTSDPFSYVGCHAAYSAAVTPIGIIYLNRSGLYNFDGQYSRLISDAVSVTIDDMFMPDLDKYSGAYLNNEYRLAYTSKSQNDGYPNRVLVYDFTRDAYTMDKENIGCFAPFNSGVDTGILFSGSSTTDGVVFAHSGGDNILFKNTVAELNAGTFTDARAYLDRNGIPTMEIAWTGTIADEDADPISTATGIIARPDTDGNWISPVYYVGASELLRLYWNENLNSYGDITVQIRTDSDSDMTGISWSSEFSTPNGLDISSLVTANTYLQVKVNLSTSNIAYSPYLYRGNDYLFKIVYSTAGTAYETSVTSRYSSGWANFELPSRRKLIKWVRVFYTGESGTLDVNLKNDEGDIDTTFSIDLSVSADASNSDAYTGDDEDVKIYTYYPAGDTIGTLWKISLSDDGVDDWSVLNVEVLFDTLEVYP